MKTKNFKRFFNVFTLVILILNTNYVFCQNFKVTRSELNGYTSEMLFANDVKCEYTSDRAGSRTVSYFKIFKSTVH